MHTNGAIARALAHAFLAGSLDVDGMVARGGVLFGKRWRWLRPLARRVCRRFGGRTPPRHVEVATFILGDQGFWRATEREDELQLVERLTPPAVMTPVAAAGAWNLPAIHSPGDLATWLGITVRELDWFADRRLLEARCNQGRLRHYNYRTVSKRFGHVRLIEAPKPRLKGLQCRILAEILDQVPPHAAAHGFRRGRSITSFAAPHAGHDVVLRMDLVDFFPSISLGRVAALFRTVGFPECVADLLTGLCTNATPDDVWQEVAPSLSASQMRELRWRYARPHLPQGAPTSPALANLCAYRLDCRLSGLAAAAGAIYTRYADDLAFSGERDFSRVVARFQLHACATAIEEGFAVHHRKTRVMRRGVRQRLAGIVVNEHPNVLRADYDRLKATLTNCVRHGAEGQNRDGHENFRAHLLGRVSFVEMVNPARGERLRKLFDAIAW